MKLSQKFCETAPKGIYWDSQLPGFGLRVHVRTRSYIVSLRDVEKRKKQIVVGHVGDLTLNDARERARKLKDGDQAATKRLTIREACELYLSEWSKPRKRSWRKDEQRVNRLILPSLGSADIESLRPLDIVRWHKSITAPYEANRALELLCGVYSYHLRMCRIACPNPCRAAVPNREQARCRVLTVDEVRRFRSALEDIPQSPKTALLLLLYTGRRVNEILSLEWSDVHLEHDPCLVIDAEKCKQKREIVVPLSKPALDAIIALVRKSRFVFPSPEDSEKPRFSIRCWWLRAIKKAGLADVRLHDLRRSVASALAHSGRTMAECASAIGDTTETTERHYVHFQTKRVRELLEQYAMIIQ